MLVALVHCTPEIWAPVTGYEGLYEVSDQGRVRSVDRVVFRSTGTAMKLKGRILKPRAQKSGHLLIWLCRDGVAHAINVHRLVAIAFIGPCPPGKECCHENGQPDDNRAENLRWDTRASNIKQSYSDGRQPTYPGFKGLSHPSSKLTAEIVRCIRESPLSCSEAGRAFGVSAMTVSRCRRALTYQEVA